MIAIGWQRALLPNLLLNGVKVLPSFPTLLRSDSPKALAWVEKPADAKEVEFVICQLMPGESSGRDCLSCLCDQPQIEIAMTGMLIWYLS